MKVWNVHVIKWTKYSFFIDRFLTLNLIQAHTPFSQMFQPLLLEPISHDIHILNRLSFLDYFISELIYSILTGRQEQKLEEERYRVEDGLHA